MCIVRFAIAVRCPHSPTQRLKEQRYVSRTNATETTRMRSHGSRANTSTIRTNVHACFLPMACALRMLAPTYRCRARFCHLRQTPLEKSKVAILRPTRYRASQNTWTGHGEPSPTSPDTHHPHISARFGLAQRPRRGGRVRCRLRHARAAMRRARTRRSRAPASGATDGRITFAS